MRKKGRKKRAKAQTPISHDVQQDHEKEPDVLACFADSPEVDEPYQHIRRITGGKVPYKYDD